MSKWAYSKNATKFMLKSSLLRLYLFTVVASIATFILIIIYGTVSNKTYDESVRYNAIEQTKYTYNSCKTEYTNSASGIGESYKKVFNELDKIFLGPMDLSVYNQGVKLYMDAHSDYKTELKNLMNDLEDEDIISGTKIAIREIKVNYFNISLLSIYASNTKLYTIYLLLPIMIAFALISIVFCLPDKEMTALDIIDGIPSGW